MNRVTLAELERFGVSEAIESPEGRRSSGCEPDAPGGRGVWAGLLAGCGFAQSCSDPSNAQGLPEPHWYALASLLSRCDDGQIIFHEISALDRDRYDPAETDRKFIQAQTASAPRTCRSIHNELGFDGCRQCTFWRHA